MKYGPEWRESWALSYLKPLDEDTIRFLAEEARRRLKAHQEHKTIPLLADIYVSRLVASMETKKHDV